MIIKTNDKEIPKGFFLQKDYLLSKLFVSKKKQIIPIQTLSFQSSPIKTNLYLQIIKKKSQEKHARNLKSINVFINCRNKYRFRKAFLPNFSSIDFHQNYQTKGAFQLGFMEDDLNITSIHSKKFYYTNRDNRFQAAERTIEDHNALNQFGKTAIISSLPKFNSVFFSNEKLKQINTKPVTGTSWFQTELPKAKHLY